VAEVILQQRPQQFLEGVFEALTLGLRSRRLTLD